MPDVIQGLWVGARLSAMERLCIASFLKNGHPFHLYVYSDVAGIPPGTVVKSGRDILPDSSIFTYRDHDTYAGFANFFRYKLLLEKGGWFVDLDTICLQPFEFAGAYVFSSERASPSAGALVNLAAMKVPPGSGIMQWAWQQCQALDPRQLLWGQSGPLLITRGMEQFKLNEFVHPPDVFCPIGHTEWKRVLAPGEPWTPGIEPFAVHLWNERWRRAGQSKDGDFDGGCLYQQLQARYLENDAGAGSIYEQLLPAARKYSALLPAKLPAELTVLMLSHNRPDRTAGAVQCLFEHLTIPFHLLLIDNGSGLATQAALRQLTITHPSIEFIQLAENLGCAGGRMFGLDRVKTEFVLLLDNDVSVLPGAVEYLVLALRNRPEAVASTGRVVLPDGRIHLCGGRFLVEDDLVQAQLLDFGKRHDEAIEPSGVCDWVPGAMTVVRTAQLQQHRYDPKLAQYYEDLEWCLRLKKNEPDTVFLRCIEALGVHDHQPKQQPSGSDRIARSMPYLEAMAYLYQIHKLLAPGIIAFLPELSGVASARLLFELLSAKGGAWLALAWERGDLRPLIGEGDHERLLDQQEQAIRFLRQENADLRASLQNREEAVAFLEQENRAAKASPGRAPWWKT